MSVFATFIPPEPAEFAQARELLGEGSEADRTGRMLEMLRSGLGTYVRQQVGKALVELLQVERMVPGVYCQWTPLVCEALRFVVMRLSEERLAPKIIEQLDLPADATSEVRLLRFISRMPCLQKLGQILARNRYIAASLRAELIQLENGISETSVAEIETVIRRELGSRVRRYAVEVEPAILSEATVSAVLRFRWRDPASQNRGRGVFKVLKPHVPAYFAEDLELLQQLGEHLEERHADYGLASNVILDTLHEVRALLEHEVQCSNEQSALRNIAAAYGSQPGVRSPQLIAPLCSSQITAMSEEAGVKITDAVEGMPAWRRHQIATQVIEILLGLPLFASESTTTFHADPHAGNLFYDTATGELVVLDWALAEQLTISQRRHIALLSILLALRDGSAVCREIEALCRASAKDGGARREKIQSCVSQFLATIALDRVPGFLDVVHLLDELVLQGVLFPSALLMFRKALFTLDGILHEIAGPAVSLDITLSRILLGRWIEDWPAIGFPLMPEDWLTLHWSLLSYGGRLWAASLGLGMAPGRCSLPFALPHGEPFASAGSRA